MKRILIYIITIVLLVACGVGVYCKVIAPRLVRSSAIPFTVQQQDITSITVQGRKGVFLLNRSDGWVVSIAQPAGEVRIRADKARIAELLTALYSMKPLSAVFSYSTDQAAEYGLDSALLEVGITGKKPHQQSRTIFAPVSDSNEVYVWASAKAQRLYRIKNTILKSIARPDSFYRDSRILPFNAGSVIKIQLAQRYGAGWTLLRGKDGFSFESPVYLAGKIAANSEVRFYLSMLAGLTAHSFVAADMVLPKEPEAFLHVWVEGEHEPLKLAIHKPSLDEEFLATSSFQPGVFRLDVESVQQLLKTPFEMQGRRVLDLETGKIAHITIIDPDQSFAVQKVSDGWVVETTQKRVPGIDMSLWRFKELKFEALPLRVLPKTASWLMSCELRDGAGNSIASLKFFSDTALPTGQSWIKNGEGLFFPVTSQIMNDLRGLLPGKIVK